MGDRILVAYATKKGSTREVAEDVAHVIEDAGCFVDVRAAGEVESVEGYSGVVLGGALYMGRLHRDARRFLQRFRTELAELPTAVFAMGPGTAEEADVRRSRAQLERALEAIPELEPRTVAIFGGVVDPAQLRFPFNRMSATDARDWGAIREWASDVARELAARSPVRVG